MTTLEDIMENGWAKLIAVFFVTFATTILPTLGAPNINLNIVFLQAFLNAGVSVGSLFLSKPFTTPKDK